VFIDGFPALTAEFELDIVDLSTVEGIEVYPGLASVPAPFQAPRAQHRCGVVAVWSRPAPLRAGKRRTEQPVRVATLVERGAVYAAADVDEPARLVVEASPEPVYPEASWKAGVGGEVVIEVVVDTLGRAESGSVSIVTESTPAFGIAAREAIRESVFTVAFKGGRRVRQVVHVPVVFLPGSGGRSDPGSR
jgi:TonB family protein